MNYTSWKVTRNGKDLGIIESNYPYASQYWEERSRQMGKYFKLVPISKRTKDETTTL